MPKPILFAVDDDPEVLKAVERDLRSQYGERYRVMRAAAGDSALAALEQLQAKRSPVALLLVDQRMPKMTGVELLERAIPLFPAAKRVLLTAYADTGAAIQAINTARVDHYLLKPWDPPAENLYPVLDDLLADWQAAFRPPFEGIRVVGHRWSPASFEARDFLARHQVPYEWLDVEVSEEARRLAESAEGAGGPEAAVAAAAGVTGAAAKSLPMVFFPDGSHLVRPTRGELAERIGLRTQAEKPFYDLVIVGGGPSGLAAAVYGASEGLRTLMIEGDAPGGQAGTSSRIENYLGFPSGLSGADLTRRAVAQATRFGVEILNPQEAKGLKLADPYRIVTLADGSEVSCHALLVATGVSYRKLDVPGVERLTGAGVYYGAAMTEAIACRDEDVYIVGGANSAGQAAMYFARYARRVTLLVRGDSLQKGMSQYLVDQICSTANIEVRFQTSVAEARGEESLQELVLRGGEAGALETVPAGSLFILIGAQPRTGWLEGVVERDANGFLLSGPDLPADGNGNGHRRPRGWPLDRDPFLLETSVPGVFVAGDVRHGSVKRVASGVGEGAIAVSFIHQYLARL
ncbi:MAG TPA: FAD-dependent oxidoreductase [Thermoanaerobaculia bacterium]|nr:FAD-dependent oxidoreductase [Thermoanaerobaculia bacterium]